MRVVGLLVSQLRGSARLRLLWQGTLDRKSRSRPGKLQLPVQASKHSKGSKVVSSGNLPQSPQVTYRRAVAATRFKAFVSQTQISFEINFQRHTHRATWRKSSNSDNGCIVKAACESTSGTSWYTHVLQYHCRVSGRARVCLGPRHEQASPVHCQGGLLS